MIRLNVTALLIDTMNWRRVEHPRLRCAVEFSESGLALLESSSEVEARYIERLAYFERKAITAAGIYATSNNKELLIPNVSWVNSYKRFYGCSYCGEHDPVCLDLHHRAGIDKIAAVSYLVVGSPFVVVRAEAYKCEVLCANCHRKSHHRERHGLSPLSPPPYEVVHDHGDLAS